jgi:hypothetical protein
MEWDGLGMVDDADLGLYISWTYSSPFTSILEYAVCHLPRLTNMVGYIRELNSISIRPRILRCYDLHSFSTLTSVQNEYLGDP